jgi:CRISPR-associated protein Csm5
MNDLNHSPLDKLDNYKKNNYEYKRIQLTSPLLHIGVGETGALNLFEYIQENGNIYFPNLTALVEVLHNPENIQKSKAIQKARKPQESRSEFLKQFEQLSQDYIRVIETQPADQVKLIGKILSDLKRLYDQALGKKWLDNETIIPDTAISNKWVNRLIARDIAPMIRNGFGEIYIPGSSIKGAIRTAIAYYLLKHQVPKQKSEIEQQLATVMSSDQIKKNKKFMDDQKLTESQLSFNSYLFSNFKLKLPDYKQPFGKPDTANTDFLRAIKVTDSIPLLIDDETEENLPVVAEVLTSSFQESKGLRMATKKAYNCLEMIWNLKSESYIVIDKAMLDQFQHEQRMQLPSKLKTVQGILEICQEFAQHQWEHEQRYWSSITDSPNLNFSSVREFYANPCSYNLRLGSGSGMTGTTVDLLFQEATRAKIRDACGKPTNSTETPKSRRTALIPNQGNPIKQPLGWVNLTVI